MEPIIAQLHGVAARRRALAIPDDEDIERAWRRWTGLDLEARNVCEAAIGQERSCLGLSGWADIYRASNPGAQDAGHGEGAAVSGISERGPAPGFRWN